MKDFYMRPWSMAEKVLLTAAAVLAGMVTGALFASKKREGCVKQGKSACNKEKLADIKDM